MSNRPVNRLLGLEIDEVSLVDRPANQHGLVTITKRDEGAMATGLYDDQGVEFELDELEPGMSVLDADGQELVIVDDELAAELEDEGYSIEDLDGELVGKAAGAAITGGAHTAYQAGRSAATRLLGHVDGVTRRSTGSSVSEIARAGGRSAADRGRRAVSEAGPAARRQAFRGTMRSRAAVGRRPLTAVGVAGGVGYGSGRVRKSAGQQVLEELSKAYTDRDRDQVIAKALDALEESDSRAVNAERIAKALEDRAELGEYVELAKSYQLPVDEQDFGSILHRISKNAGLDDEELDFLDRVFHAAGEAVFLEKGAGGTGGESGVMDLVEAQAYELVGKAGGNVSAEQASVALFESNPDAYLEYLSEMRS